jgi:hypothetical protein
MLGDIAVMNQDLISDYTKVKISGLDKEIFDNRVIVNCHRLEMMPKASDGESSFVASPGALCDPHVIRTIKQIDFEDSRTVKQAFYGGFSKYRKMEHTNKYWDKALFIVNVNANGQSTIVPCIIKKIGNDYAMSYFDKIITSSRVVKPDMKTFVVGDLHAPKHDKSVLSIQQQICNDYQPDNLVNIGDSHNYSCLNHHEMSRGVVIKDKVIAESAEVHFILKKQALWAKKKYVIVGNHERFASDFMAKLPQLDELLDFNFICDVDSLDYAKTDLKDVLRMNGTKFIHGEMKIFGQSGDKLEKVSKTFGRDTFIGHVHYPAIRFGCYSIGLSGCLDQGYNEPHASNWIHGFGMVNHYKNVSFPTTIPIIEYNCQINGVTYFPVNVAEWDLPKFTARMSYTYE